MTMAWPSAVLRFRKKIVIPPLIQYITHEILNEGLMLFNGLRLWPNIKTALGQCLVCIMCIGLQLAGNIIA